MPSRSLHILRQSLREREIEREIFPPILLFPFLSSFFKGGREREEGDNVEGTENGTQDGATVWGATICALIKPQLPASDHAVA